MELLRFCRIRFLEATALALLAACAVTAQEQIGGIPRIDSIEYYGLHSVTPELAKQALGLKEGSLLPPSKGDAEDRLLDIDRVVSAQLEAVCCDGGKTVLYVGIEELGQPRLEIRPAPGGSVVLPDEVIAEYNATLEAERAKSRRTSLLPKLLTGEVLQVTRDVLRDSGEDLHRAIAAYVLPYATNPSEMVNDLRFALTDNDGQVRANTIRSLMALAEMEKTNPASKIRVAPEWFVPLLNSISWSDRTLGVTALVNFTNERNPALLAKLGNAELDSLVEMSRWRTEQYAYPAFLLIGRVAGLEDLAIRDNWLRAGRDTVIAQARSARK